MPVSGRAAIEAARAANMTVAVAESVTGGMLAASLTDTPGSSDVFLGGVVSYDLEAKTALLGVPVEMLADSGPVSEAVAIAMAHGVRAVFHADVAVATTGVAGPADHGGEPAGRVCIAVVSTDASWARTMMLDGDRAHVRRAAVSEALHDLVTVITRTQTSGTSVRYSAL